MTCIYCLQNKTRFNPEHIIPKCLGKFKNNLTLTELVCSDCNQYFGDELEIHLRDSIEGIARYRYGMHPEKEPDYKRLKLEVSSPGKLQGVHVKPRFPEKNGIDEAMLLRSEVGFYNSKTNKYVYFGKDEIPKREELEKQGFVLIGKEIVLWGNVSELVEACKQRGISIEETAIKIETPSYKIGGIEVRVEARIDRALMRAYSKMAFNYFAFNNGRTFAQREYFNGIRNFILNDQGNVDDYFKIVNIPILKRELRAGRRDYPGHIVMIEMTDQQAIIGRLALFNLTAQITYTILLCRKCPIIFNLTRAHGFNLKTKKIEIFR